MQSFLNDRIQNEIYSLCGISVGVAPASHRNAYSLQINSVYNNSVSCDGNTPICECKRFHLVVEGHHGNSGHNIMTVLNKIDNNTYKWKHFLGKRSERFRAYNCALALSGIMQRSAVRPSTTHSSVIY